jgi:hypothetical protein
MVLIRLDRNDHAMLDAEGAGLDAAQAIAVAEGWSQ